MISFFKDQAMTLQVLPSAPKRVLLPTTGGSRQITLWIGDPYTSAVAQNAAPNATTLVLTQVSELLPAGSITVDDTVVHYTGITGTTLTGVTGLTNGAYFDDIVVPNTKWIVNGNLSIIPVANDPTHSLFISAKRSDQGSFSFPGSPALYSLTSYATGSAPIAVNVQLTLSAGAQTLFENWNLLASTFYKRDANDSTAPGISERGALVRANGYLFQRDQGLEHVVRVLDASRKLPDTLPGFVFGSYRWRDQNSTNAVPIVPGSWEVDINAIGIDKFITGIGQGDDLAPQEVNTQPDDSVVLSINNGFYFTGPNGYYLPAQPVYDKFPGTATRFPLTHRPAAHTPIFIGTFLQNSKGFYEKDVQYTYKALGVDTSSSEYQFTINRVTNEVTLNRPLSSPRTLFLGVSSGGNTDVFDFPLYPLWTVSQVYYDQSIGNPKINCPSFTLDSDLKTVTVSNPNTGGIHTAFGSPGGLGTTQYPVYAVCVPAVLAWYDTAEPNTSFSLTDVDLNPAFSGLTRGFVYLQHGHPQPENLTLESDKPQIVLPAGIGGISEIANGPVYFNGDYSLLTAKVTGINNADPVPDVELQVIVDPSSFRGYLNYEDPTSIQVTATTGGDGVANLIYTPGTDYGIYMPPASVSGATLTLPVPVPVEEIWSNGLWSIQTYALMNNSPLYGMAGAGQGQVPWTTSGVAGTSTYKTNGLRSNLNMNPIHALDSTGADATVTGNPVVKLVYPSALPTAHVGAYMVIYLYQVTIQLQTTDGALTSNPIILQMALAPEPLQTDPWLILDDMINGVIGQYRLGTVPTY